MDNAKNNELNLESLDSVAGGEGVNTHICGICGSDMRFLREQEGASRYVFQCPRCSNIDVFRKM